MKVAVKTNGLCLRRMERCAPFHSSASALWFLVAAFAHGLALSAHAGDLGRTFEAGNKLYEQGEFTKAAAEYSQIIQSGQASAPVYFNLGNAFFKAGQIGRAILAYQQARAMNPRDPDVLANLQFARNQVQGPTLAPDFMSRWLGKLSLNEWTVATAAALWICFLFLILRQWRPGLKRTLSGWTIGAAIVTGLLGTCLITQWYRIHIQPTAVVVAVEAPLHQAPLVESPSPVTLRDGAEVRVLDRKDDWLQVSTDTRRIGWVQRDRAVVVQAE